MLLSKPYSIYVDGIEVRRLFDEDGEETLEPPQASECQLQDGTFQEIEEAETIEFRFYR